MGIKKTIAFESDHNGWKWSQIKKIAELAEVLGLDVITTRGAVYREGKCTSKWEPDSPIGGKEWQITLWLIKWQRKKDLNLKKKTSLDWEEN